MSTLEQSDREKRHYTFYKENLEKYSPFSVKALRWNSKESQLARFNSLLRIGSYNNSSILDVGSGISDLYFFLKDKGFSNFRYTGIEIIKEFFEVAKNKLQKYPECKLIKGDFFTYQFLEKYDITICNGSLNLKEENNYNVLKNFIEKSYKITKKAIGITLLKNAEGYIEDKNLFHYSETMVEKLIKTMNIKNYKIYSDYIDNDFTLIIWI